MKKYLAFLLFALMLSSCSSNNTPLGIADAFLTNIKKGDYEEAKKYGTSGTVNIMNAAIMMTPQGQPIEKTNFRILRDSVINDRAFVFYVDEKYNRVDILNMVKIDGKWKVDYKKKK